MNYISILIYTGKSKKAGMEGTPLQKNITFETAVRINFAALVGMLGTIGAYLSCLKPYTDNRIGDTDLITEEVG